MSMFDLGLMTATSLMALGAVGLLYLCWKRTGRPGLLTVGWALLAMGCILAFLANGDRGVAQVTLVVMAGATMIFAIGLLRGLAPTIPAARERRDVMGARHRRHRLMTGFSSVWTFLITGPVAGGIALFASAGLFKLLRPEEGNPATAGAIAIIAAVLIWAALSVALLMEPRSGRRSIYAGVALIGALASAFI
ncbi:MAG: hypothetical protein WA989_11620 [Henriciella sp.]|uniref:hypothetical protein n=1 Tax=Henriciella sp. TaxID=1968823 RepID=UPI003C744246